MSHQRWHALVVAIVAVAAYAPSMRNAYVLDDVLVSSTSADRATAPLSTLFDHNYFVRYNQDTYRPVATLTSMVDHRVGVDPRLAGRAQSILWHAGTAVLIVLLAARFLPGHAPLVAGLFFAVHPIATESTLAIGYREDAIVACLLVAALLLTWSGKRSGRALALVCHGLALFTKENAIVFPALLALARLTLPRDRPLDRRALARELAAFGLVSLGYLVVRLGVMASPMDFADPAGGDYLRTLVAVPRIFAHDLRLLVVPWPQLVLYYNVFPIGAPFLSQVPWLLLDVALVAGAVRLARTQPVISFGLLWFMLAMTPSLHFIPLRVAAADRFLHLSLVGGAVAAGAAFALGAGALRPSLRLAVHASAVVGLFALLLLTEQRVRVWHDELTLWRDTLRHNPHAYHGHFMLAADHEAHGRLGPARREFEAAVAECPRDSAFGRSRFCAYFASKLGFLCARGGDASAAVAAFDQSLAFSPGFPPAYVGLGHLRLAAGDIPGARKHLEAARAAHARLPVVVAMIDDLASAIDRAALAARED